MCDTIAVVNEGRVLFAKNSDRDANEGQALEWHPRRLNESGASVKCTYLEIPEVRETFATMISRPFWMWGAEMGANEHGVTIGNEAVFTNEPYEKEPGLIGMDLLRLALERSADAQSAVNVITSLLERHGQGGGCGHEHSSFTYHNSYIVADPKSAFVLETAGRKWAVEEISGPRTISNVLTIPEFAQKHSDFLKTRVAGGRDRRERTQCIAQSATNVEDLMGLLRDHGEGRETPAYHWTNGGLHAPCVHAGGVLASSQTTASWVAELSADGSRHWATGTAAPCTSIFKPVRVDAPVDLGPPPGDEDDGSLWWRHERFHRAVMRNPEALFPLFANERDELEKQWIANPPESHAVFEDAGRLLETWTERVQSEPVRDVRPSWTRRYWKKRNERAGIHIFNEGVGERRVSDAS